MAKLIRNIIFIFFFLFELCFAQNRNLRFEHLSVEDGLSQNLVNCIYQDSKGFMWFGTHDGLNRYDGYNFKVFRHEPGNLNSLSDYAVNAIAEDDSGFLWIATRDGLNKFDPKTESFKTFKIEPQNKNSLTNNFISALLVDDKNNLWIGTRGGLNKLDLTTYKFSSFQIDPANDKSLIGKYVTAIHQKKDGSLWIGTTAGLCKFIPETGTFISFKNDPNNNNTISSNLINFFAEDSQGNLWIGTNSGLNLLKNNEEKFIRFIEEDGKNSLRGNFVRSICIDEKGVLWIATMGGGLNKFYPTKQFFENYKNIFNDKQSLSSNYLISLFIDKSGVVWIGSQDKGLSKFSPKSQKFIHIQQSENDISGNYVQSFFEDENGTLWIGTENGLQKMDSKFNFQNNNFNYGLVNKSITSIIKDRNKNYWIGTFGDGLYKIKDEKVIRYAWQKNNPNSLSNNFIHTLFEDKNGMLWIGTGLGGLVKFDTESNIFKTYKPNPNDPNSISSVEVTSIIEDDKFLWIGTTTGGLNKFDKEKEIFYNYKHDPQNLKSISSTRINTLFKDDSGDLWIGTFGGGLNKYNVKENSFTFYNSKDGLPGNNILGITQDGANNLWISSSNGISKFNLSNKSFKNFDVNDGLQANEFIENSCYKSSKTGLIYFGGVNGFNVFHPDNIKDDDFISPIVITDFKIFNKTISLNNYSENGNTNIAFIDELTLPYDQNVFSFEFASLDFSNPAKNKFKYKMEGFDKNWITADKQNFASFTNLDPGSYVFKVMGTNGDGVWNPQTASINIKITPPWWLTWWAYVIYASLFIAALFTIRRYEMNRIKLKNDLKLKEFESEKLQEVDKIKSRFFANLSHEFRTPLTIILGSLEKLKREMQNNPNEKDFEVMKRNAARLLQLINQLLELSRIESGSVKLNASENDIVKFLKRITASFSSLAYQKNIDLKFNNFSVEDMPESESILLFLDKKKLETVFYNLLSNAVKFSPEGEAIDVNISQAENSVKIKFSNTGVEIQRENISKIFDRFYQADEGGTGNFEGTGIGLALAKEYVELHKGKIEVVSGNKKTMFTVYLQLGSAHLSEDEINYEETEVIFEAEDFSVHSLPAATDLSEDDTEKGKTIVLVVEDNFDLREMIKEILHHEYRVVEAENGIEGLKRAEEIIPDLIISDIMMPRMDGYEFSRKIKESEKTNHIPIIILTAKAATEDKLQGLEIGADDYLIKPFDEKELKIRIKNLIKIRRQMRKKFQSQMLIKPSEVVVPSSQKMFIEKLTAIIEENISAENLSVEMLCEKIGMSRTQLHRKIKAITNQSTSEFVRNFRLQRAADLIKNDFGNMAEVAYKVGFNSQAYFTKSFQEVYGCTPSDYKKKHSINS